MRPLSWRPRRLPRTAITPCESPTSLVTSHHRIAVDGSGELSGSSLGASGRFRSVDDPDPYRSISAIHDDDFKDARQRVSAHSVTTCFAGHPATNGSRRPLASAGSRATRGVLDPVSSFERTSDAPSLRGLPVERLTASPGVGPRIVRAPWSTRISGRTRQPRSFRSSLVKYSSAADPERLSPSHPCLPGPRLALAF
jgi:hypothetical protein